MPLKLSILIDTYNHEKYIDAAIRSVLAQEGLGQTELDIIVVDDGSTDKTGEIVQSFVDKLRYYRKPNGGQASAFNFGIPLCQGDVICFLDGDDWWYPNKLRAVKEVFERNPAVCAVGHSFREADEVAGDSVIVGPATLINIDFSLPNSIDLFHKFCCCLGTSRLAMRRSAARAVLVIPQELVFEADEYMFTLLPCIGQVIILPDALTYYRIHGANLYQGSRSLAPTHKDNSRLWKRAAIYGCLAKQLPVELAKRGSDLLLINRLLGPVEVQASRLKLMTRGGTPLENFRSERRAAAVDERSDSLNSRIVLWMSLGLAIMLPPKCYFRIREIYSGLLRRGRSRSVARGSA